MSRLIPGDESDPGAREAGAARYIDLALAGYHKELQAFYRRGLTALDELCTHLHSRGFAELGPDLQDGVLRGVEAMSASEAGEGRLLQQFLAVFWEHTIQGTFGDPVYGGNRDCVGWSLVGFPGAQWSYPTGAMDRGFDSRSIPVLSLADLQQLKPWEAP